MKKFEVPLILRRGAFAMSLAFVSSVVLQYVYAADEPTEVPEFADTQDRGLCRLDLKPGVAIENWRITGEQCRLFCEQSGFAGERLRSHCIFSADSHPLRWETQLAPPMFAEHAARIDSGPDEDPRQRAAPVRSARSLSAVQQGAGASSSRSGSTE